MQQKILITGKVAVQNFLITHAGQATPVALTTSPAQGQLSIALPDVPCEVAIRLLKG